ncbi:MAG: hypothetical protein JOZ83_03585 [Silvibacterium sp.]|nr:hypothetical protein [Silvibacterium sp.]
MEQEQRRYRLAGFCMLLFIAGQTFQEAATRFWIPPAKGPDQELLTHLLAVDRVRALLILISILLLVIPYIVIARRYWPTTPIAAASGLIAVIGFVGFEFTARSIDFFVVGQHWASAFRSSNSPQEKTIIVHRYVLWSDMVRGMYFELLLSYLLGSSAFLYATLRDNDRWSRLASLAFALNALRLIGRIASTFAHQVWLDSLNNSAYFPAVFAINCLLAMWLFHLGRRKDIFT